MIKLKTFEILENTKSGKDGEIQLTDCLNSLRQIEGMYVYNFESKRYDEGDKLGFLQVIVECALMREELKSEFLDYLKEVVHKSSQEDFLNEIDAEGSR